MGHFETAQEHHCREDILMRRFQPMDWYLQLSPWASAADQLFAAGFPEVAADAYRETLKRAAALRKKENAEQRRKEAAIKA